MQVPLWIWLLTAFGFVALLALSFLMHVRKAHAPTLAEAGTWTAVFVALSVIFGVGIGVVWTPAHALEYFAGYITEYSLSIDNLFVFVLIMGGFAVPRIHQERVLMVGIAIALVLRTVFILLGAAAIARFSWVFYLFGLFLILTGAKLAVGKHEDSDEYEPNFLVRAVGKCLPVSPDYDGARLTTRLHGRFAVTPMLMVMLTIGFTDILFALDSIPAIYGLTNVPYIVFGTNAFALLGLVELYFLIGGLLKRLVYLSVGLALILAFIGIKLVIEALHGNNLPFLNGGDPIHLLPEIPTWLSLVIILAILTVTTVASLLKNRSNARLSAG